MGYLSHSKTETIAQISPSKTASKDTAASISQYSQLTRLFSADRFLQMDSLGYLETPTVPMDFPPRSRAMSHYNEGYNGEAATGNTSFQYSDTLSPQYSTHIPVDIPVCNPMAAFCIEHEANAYGIVQHDRPPPNSGRRLLHAGVHHA